MVEDDLDLREAITEALRLQGYTVDCTERGDEAEQRAFDEAYDLVLLDLNLPGMDGMEVLRRFRAHDQETGVLILSARADLENKVKGLDEGANDYLTKPFHMEELFARVRSLLRRRTVQPPSVLIRGSLHLDTAGRRACVDGKPLPLTAKELALLEYLLLHAGRVVSQQELLEHVWGDTVDELSNSVRVHLSTLRRKLREALGYDPIHNRVGEGYCWEDAL